MQLKHDSRRSSPPADNTFVALITDIVAAALVQTLVIAYNILPATFPAQ